MMSTFMDLRCKQRKEKQLSSYELMFVMNKVYKGSVVSDVETLWSR